MSNQVMQQQQNQVASSNFWTKPVVFQANGEEVKLTGNMVKDYLVRGGAEVSEQEVVMFLNLCKFQKLNPFLNEAYLVKFKGSPAQIITSKEAFMKRAETHPKYEGFQAGIIVERKGEMVEIEGAIKLKEDVLVGGWCKIYREDRKHPITAKISLEEFSKGQATWKQMPLTMIRKSAIVNGLREAFPETLGAMYTEDDADVKQPVENSIQQEIAQNANQELIDVSPSKSIQQAQPEPEYIDAHYVESTEQMQQEQLLQDEGPGF